MTADDLCTADLRHAPVFADLDEPQLAWLVEQADCRELAAGDLLWTDGDAADALFVVLAGTIRLYLELAGQTLQVDSHRWGGVIGLLPYSRMKEFPGNAVASEPSRLLRIGRERFPDMLQAIPELGYRLVGIMSDRVRERTRAEQQREKMIALGKLSAGLAHELNNPAAAVQRTVKELSERLRASNAMVLKLAEHGLDIGAMRAVVALRGHGDGAAAELSPLERGRREDELADWLAERGVAAGWKLAATFVDAGLDAGRLEALRSELPAAAVPDALAWIESGIAAKQLLAQVATAAARVSHLVKSVKSYSHMDQSADKQPADLHRGLDETLTILGHCLRTKNVRLTRRYAADLPPVPVYFSELNQVWTNLIDNAIDAVAEGGAVEVSTGHDPCSVYVRVTDDGPGIPEAVQPRVFEPFYTTKAQGHGTGLGLDVAQRIVLQHQGELTFETRPGRTSFVVRLPKG
ncbi:MAG TPA: ATP-binding protein [Thermoanaerobaculia bacterium]